MLKFLTNIIFLMIMFVLSTALPLSTDILTINISQPIVDPVTETEPLEEEVVLSWTQSRLDDDNWHLELTSSNNEFPDQWIDQFTLLVNGKKTDPVTYPLAEISQLSHTGSQINLSIPLLDIFSGQPQDYYDLQIESKTDIHQSEKITIEYATYTFDGTYLGASHARDAYMKLYYPNQDYTTLIPISREVSVGDNRWRSMYTALSRGEIVSLGLYSGTPVIPHTPNIRISNLTTSVYLYQNELTPFEDRLDLVTESISRSFLSLGYIEGVRFVVNDQTSGTYGPIDLQTLYDYSTELNAYVGYRGSEAYNFIMPISVSNTQDMPVAEKIQLIWRTLKFDNPEVDYHLSSLQLIPPHMDLLNHQLVDGILTLDFDEAFQSLYQETPWLRDLMIDSLVESFTSILEVDQVRFTIDSETFELSTPMASKKLLNILE